MVEPSAMGKVAVLMGGTSPEREISLLSGNGVLAALRSVGVDAHAFDPSERDLHLLREEGFDRCFVALHGPGGEDGTVQGALEQLRIPYTGSGVLASALAMDKVMTKRLWLSHGLATPRSRVFHGGEQEAREALEALGAPLVVKPSRGGSSLGVSLASTVESLLLAANEAERFDGEVLLEEYIAGEEVTCAVLGAGRDAEALPVVRIVAPQGNYDYQNKYFTDDTRYLVPSGLPAREEAAIQELTLHAYRALGCRGWGRADLMIRANDRKPFLLEMNTSPGMTNHSLVPMAARAVGMDYPSLCLRILAATRLDRG